MSLKASFEEVDHGQPGDWTFSEGDTHLVVRLYAAESEIMDTGLAALPIKPEKDRPGGPVWVWDGNHEAPTLSPSILHGPAGGPNRWHGYMRAGQLMNA